MSAPAPGLYYIVNTVLSATTNNLLPVVFIEPGQALTVNNTVPDIYARAWNISNIDNDTQTISPYNDQSVQAVPLGDFIITLPVFEDYPWVIRGVDDKYTIQSKEQDEGPTDTIYWDIEEPLEGQNVIPDHASDRETQNWWLYKAD